MGVPGAIVKLALSRGGLRTFAKKVKVSAAGVAVAALESVKVQVPSPLLTACVTSVPVGMSVPLTPSPTRSLYGATAVPAEVAEVVTGWRPLSR